MDLNRYQVDAAFMAEGLLAAGLLEPGDWSGHLANSISAGLHRWINGPMGGAGLRFFHLSLAFTDDVANGHDYADDGVQFGCNDTDWLQAHHPEIQGIHAIRNARVGAFALFCAEGDCMTWGQEAIVGTRIEQLERLAPEAGFSVFALAQAALTPFLAITPLWGERFLKWSGGELYLSDGDEETDDPAGDVDQEGCTGPLTTERFKAAFPEAVFTAKWDPAPVRRALRRCRRGDEVARDALNAALELGELWKSLEPGAVTDWDHFFGGDVEACPCMLLRWSEEDPLARVCDDYTEHIHESSTYTPAIFIRAFLMNDRSSLERCLKGFENGVRLLLLADRLLHRLHQRTTLVGILAEEAAPLEVAVER